jgi:4-hydroxy-3-methylbut-2-enyl diphosphate reductase
VLLSLEKENRPMKVVLAESLGMCFGVRDAIALALRAPSDLTILGELVHNPHVLNELRVAGARVAVGLDGPIATGRVMITAHGAAESRIARLRHQGLEVENATCPLVGHAHRSLDRLVAEGYFPVVLGRRGHVEVVGMVGDLTEYAVIESESDFPALEGRARLGVVSQTTQPLEWVEEMVERIRLRFPEAEVRFVDTVCLPTKERQAAARRLGAQCAVVIVVGGRGSNNTRQLVRACEAGGARAYQVESAEEIRPEWLRGTDGRPVECVGLTAGTSTPDAVIASVRRALEQWDRQPLREAA